MEKRNEEAWGSVETPITGGRWYDAAYWWGKLVLDKQTGQHWWRAKFNCYICKRPEKEEYFITSPGACKENVKAGPYKTLEEAKAVYMFIGHDYLNPEYK